MLMPNEGDSQGELNYIRMRAAALYAENEAAGATIATLEKLLRESNNRYNELKAIVEASQDKSFDESMTTPQQYILGSLESRIEDLERELASSVGHIGSLVMAKSSLELKAAEALDRKSALMQKLRLLQSNGQVEQNNFNTPISMITERPNSNSNFTDDEVLGSTMQLQAQLDSAAKVGEELARELELTVEHTRAFQGQGFESVADALAKLEQCRTELEESYSRNQC